MAVKTVVSCDLTDKELDQLGVDRMTTVTIAYKHMGHVTDPKTGKDIPCLLDIQNYQLHISAEKAPEFMEGIKELINKLKEE